MLFRYGARVELRHLRYFVTVAEELNLTRAAARLHVAQPALSRQIKDLEAELTTPLFERRHAGVQLTPAGRAFYPRARDILTAAAEAANEARSASGMISGRVTVGYPSGIHLNHLAPLLTAFREAHPTVEFDFVHDLPAEQFQALRDARIDLGFMNSPAPAEDMDQLVIWRLPFKVVLPVGHRLARRREFVLTDLRHEDFVFCPREARPDFYDEFFRVCAHAGFYPRIVKEVGGYPSNILGLVSVGVGVSVLPHFEQAERIEGIVWRTLAKPKATLDSALVWRRQNRSRVLDEFLALARKLYPLPDSGSGLI